MAGTSCPSCGILEKEEKHLSKRELLTFSSNGNPGRRKIRGTNFSVAIKNGYSRSICSLSYIESCSPDMHERAIV